MGKDKIPKIPKQSARQSNLKLLQVNVRSISNKFEELETFFCITTPDVICISEHWQSRESLPSFSFEGYNLANYFCRPNSNHGGVAVYVRPTLEYRTVSEVDDLSVEFDCEMAAIEIPSCHLVVISIYHSPPPNGNYSRFFKILYDTLIFNKRDLFTFIAGDFNVNFLSNTHESKLLIDLLSSFNLRCLIDVPTRVTNNSWTCIDNIITDYPISMCEAKSIPSGFSDHNANRQIILLYGKENLIMLTITILIIL